MTDASSAPTSPDEMKAAIKGILRRIRHERDQWDGGFDELRALLTGELKSVALALLGAEARRERLDFQWKLQELLEEFAPPPPPKKEAKPEEPPAEEPAAEEEEPVNEAPGAGGVVAPLRPEDLVPIYDDPRGILIHKHKTDGRWFLTQVNPMTGQPQTVELAEAHKSQVKEELKDSPYWLEKSW